MNRIQWLWELAKRAGVAIALFFDCLGSVLVGESFRNTLSAKAWDSRDHKYWKRLHTIIDSLPVIGGKDHCKKASEREERNGGAWPGWWAKTKRVWNSV